jgi:uncharacterized cupredoxin-like copper-binding protein
MKKTVLVLLAAMMVLAGFTTAWAKNDKDKGDDDKKCNWSTRWDKNPETFRLEPGQKQEFTLIIANHEKEKSCKLELIPDGDYVKFDPSSVTIEAKMTVTVKVIVTMPPNPNNSEKAWFKYWIKPEDNEKREFKFGVHYAKKLCLFNAKWEKEYTLDPLKPGETRTQVLIVTNPSKTDSITIKVVYDAKNIEFSATSFTIKPGETFKLTVKVTQREKGDAFKTVWMFRLVAECGLKKEFSIKALYSGLCLVDLKWEKEPTVVLEPGKQATFVLLLKNLNTLESVDVTIVSDNPVMNFSAKTFTIPKGEIYKLTITITQPEKGQSNYVVWKFAIKLGCGTTKEIIFKTKYADDSKKDCLFEASFPPGQENKKMQRGKEGQVIIHVKNTSTKTIEFVVKTNSEFAKADPATFKLEPGKLAVIKINITIPEKYEKEYFELEIKVRASCGVDKYLKMKLEVTK